MATWVPRSWSKSTPPPFSKNYENLLTILHFVVVSEQGCGATEDKEKRGVSLLPRARLPTVKPSAVLILIEKAPGCLVDQALSPS